MKENERMVIPQIVLKVLEQFVAGMRDDPDIPDDAIRRLEALLRKGGVPGADDINTALFEPPGKGLT